MFTIGRKCVLDRKIVDELYGLYEFEEIKHVNKRITITRIMEEKE